VEETRTRLQTRSSSEELQRAKERRSSSLQRYGDPADIAAVAAFLASDDSSYMTGESLVVNGGGMS
jgi:NAD(P)-dependent dehydrogenase (short-subunit alcohol dehydrogenase family)